MAGSFHVSKKPSNGHPSLLYAEASPAAATTQVWRPESGQRLGGMSPFELSAKYTAVSRHGLQLQPYGESLLRTAAAPMGKTCCGCALTRVRSCRSSRRRWTASGPRRSTGPATSARTARAAGTDCGAF